jgi:ubiquinone/menaquinone biosynthesis C-methylase UbiE
MTSMRLYERYVLPRLIDLAMRNKAAVAERARLIPIAAGTVLEVGIGSGLNLPFYARAVRQLYGVDPRRELWALARQRVERAPFPVVYLQASAERIPMADGTVDAVVTTWTLCSIPDARRALREMKRVLGPEGRLLFVEHGLAPDPRVAAWQARLNPAWTRIAGGCNLDRKIDSLVRDAGFRLAEIEQAYGPGPRAMAYVYRGVALPDATRGIAGDGPPEGRAEPPSR